MNWIKFLFGFIFIALDEIIKFFIKRPVISLLLIFGFWLNSLPLPEENIVRENDVTLLGQNQKLDVNEEYRALIGSGQDKVILAAFRGKFLVNFDVNLEEKTNRLNANFRIFQRNPDEPSENLDLTASIPEDRILVKLYQLPGFGVNVPREVDLKRARNLATRERLKYLHDNTSVKTIQEAYIQFANHLKNEKTEIFLGKFGEGFENNEVYEGFYAHNPLTRNMMFFRKDSTAVGGYSLHSYMRLNAKKSEQLEADRSIF
jgi:hypothetical protein